jgi:hypothetical protein
MTLDEVVDDYINIQRVHARAEMLEFRKLSSLRHAIRDASLCHRLPSQKCHPHQRIPKAILQKAERQLRRAGHLLERTRNFEALYREIERIIGGLRGIGALTIYDIAHRVGAYLRKKPKLVYLHRGTSIGALRFGFTGNALDPRSLPSAFSRLAPDEIEDCLCIYRDCLLPSQSRARVPRQRSVCVGLPARRVCKR